MASHNKATISQQGNTKSLTVQNQEIDTPVLPAEQMERFQQFRPDINDWILNQTDMEAAARRERQAKIDRYIFTAQLIGQIFGLIIGLAGVVGGAIVAVKGYSAAGATIASLAIGTLALAFLGIGKNK